MKYKPGRKWKHPKPAPSWLKPKDEKPKKEAKPLPQVR
jgi:hypothetical protein